MVSLALLTLLAVDYRFDGKTLLRDGKPVRDMAMREVHLLVVPNDGIWWEDSVRLKAMLAASPPHQVMLLKMPAGGWRQPVREIRKMAAGETQKQLYIGFLKKTYGYQIAAVNEAYGLASSAFTDLEAPESFAKLDETRAKVLADDIAFSAEFLKDRLQVAFEALRAQLRLVLLGGAEVPEALLDALDVDGFVLRSRSVRPMATSKPLLVWGCEEPRPAFASVCLTMP